MLYVVTKMIGEELDLYGPVLQVTGCPRHWHEILLTVVETDRVVNL